MREGLADGLVQGNAASWAIVAAVWLATAALVSFGRSSGSGARTTAARALVLLAATTVTSMVALPLATAVAVPRIRWKTVDAPELVVPAGETWRRLRGPVVPVAIGGAQDLAVPTIDASDHWVLFGLLSGRAIAGLPEAPASPLEMGARRICRTDEETCRAWPASWPDASRSASFEGFAWSPTGSAGALAYDTESRLYLRRPEVAATPNEPAALEVIGRITNGPPRTGTSALFVVRGIAAGRLRAVRVVSAPSGAGHTFQLQRADVSLELGRLAFRWFAQPVLMVTSLALPAGVLAYLLAPLWFALRRRRSAADHERPSMRLDAYAWVTPRAASLGAFAAGLATAAPAVVALASLWGSR